MRHRYSENFYLDILDFHNDSSSYPRCFGNVSKKEGQKGSHLGSENIGTDWKAVTGDLWRVFEIMATNVR